MHEGKSVGKACGKGFLSPNERPKETVPVSLWIRYSLKVTSVIPAAGRWSQYTSWRAAPLGCKRALSALLWWYPTPGLLVTWWVNSHISSPFKLIWFRVFCSSQLRASKLLNLSSWGPPLNYQFFKFPWPISISYHSPCAIAQLGSWASFSKSSTLPAHPYELTCVYFCLNKPWCCFFAPNL